MREQRINFPDYPAKEQEMDACGIKYKEIYLSKVNGEWGAYMPRKKGDIVMNAGKVPFIEFVKGIIEDFPNYRLRCVKNEGINEKIAFYQRYKVKEY